MKASLKEERRGDGEKKTRKDELFCAKSQLGLDATTYTPASRGSP